MWPFKKKKDKAGTRWLDTVDAAYVLALQTHVPGKLGDYLTRKCLVQVMERVRTTKKECVGMERYKKVEWIPTGNGQYIKRVTYENINMGSGLYMPLGDPYDENWSVENEGSKPLVSEIRRVQW